MVEIIDEVIRRYENNANTQRAYMKSDFNADIFSLYIFVGGTCDSSGKCLELEETRHYITSHYSSVNAAFFCIDGKRSIDEVYNEFEKKISDIRREFLYPLDNWAVAAVFLQGGFNDEVYQHYLDFQDKLLKYLNSNRLITKKFIPFAMLSSTDITENTAFMNRILNNAIKKDTPVVVVTLVDPRNREISLSYRLRTVCATTLILKKNNRVFGNTSCCFASRMFTIQRSVQNETFIRLRQLLSFFLLMKSDDEDDNQKQLANSLFSMVYVNIWNRYGNLPCKPRNDVQGAEDIQSVDISPIYSVLLPEDMPVSERDRRFDNFVRKYYFDMLPLDKFEESAFYNRYKNEYGDYISGFEYLFNPSKKVNFIQNKIRDDQRKRVMLVRPEKVNLDDYRLNKFDNFCSKLEQRYYEYFERIFSTDNKWYEKTCDNYKKISTFITDLLEEISRSARKWSDIEGGLMSEPPEWGEDHREVLFDRYIDVLKSGDADYDEKLMAFCDKLFSLAADGILRAGNINPLLETLLQNDERNTKVFELWTSLLQMPLINIPGQGSNDEYHCIIPSYFDFRQKIGDITRPVEPIFYNSSTDDRIEIIHFLAIGEWNGGIVNEGN